MLYSVFMANTVVESESETASHSVVSDSLSTPLTIQPMEFSRPEYWSG